MGLGQVVGAQAAREAAWIPDFDAVRENRDLDRSVGCVVAVSDRVDDDFADRFLREQNGDRYNSAS